jgi:hypothetical protein
MKAIVFQRFCKVLDLVKMESTNQFIVDALEERFGHWLKINESFMTDEEKYLEKFTEFETEVQEDLKNHRLVKNPFYLVKLGNLRLFQEKFNQANDEYTKAIRLDEQFAENAYFNRAYSLIAEHGKNWGFSGGSNSQEVNKAIEDLKKARQLLEKREKELQLIQQTCPSGEESELIQQLGRKLNLINLQKTAINNAIGYDRASLDSDIKEFKEQVKKQSEILDNFKSLEILQSEKQKIEEKLETATENAEELTQEKTKIEVKISSFQTKDQLQETIGNIQNAIKDLEKKRKEAGVLGEAKAKDLDVKIEITDFAKVFQEDFETYREDIREFKQNGFLGTFQISEVAPIDWWSVIGVFFIGLGQMIAGAALFVFTVGAGFSVGMGLLMEGISDVITSIKDGIFFRNFSWKSWGIQKVISYTVSIVCAGMSALKNAAKTAYVAAKGAVSSATTIATQTLKEGWKLAGKKMGLELLKGGAKAAVDAFVDYGLNSTIMPEIEKEIQSQVQPSIETALLQDKNVQKMLKIDAANKNNNFLQLIKQKAMEVINTSLEQSALWTYIKGVFEGVATTAYAAATRLAGILKALCDIATYVSELVGKVLGVLKTEAKKAEVDKQISAIEERAKSSAETTSDQIQTSGTVESTKNTKIEGDIDLTNAKNEERISSDYKQQDPEVIVNTLAAHASKQISGIVKGKFFQPAISSLTSAAINKLSSPYDQKLNQEIELFKDQRKIKISLKKDPHNLLDKSYKENHMNPENMEKAQQIVDDTSSGGEMGFVHMESLSEEIGQQIQLLDENGKVVTTFGKAVEGQEPLQVQHHPPGTKSDTGHFTLPGGIEAPQRGSGSNDCLLNVICASNDIDPEKLRQNCAERMKNNIEHLANCAPSYQRLETFMSSKLFSGGARYVPGTINEIYEESQGRVPHGTTNRGHPRGHIPHPDPNHTGTYNADNAQDYSRTDDNDRRQDRTAFSSEATTKLVQDALLSSQQGQDAIATMNNKEYCPNRLPLGQMVETKRSERRRAKLELSFTNTQISTILSANPNTRHLTMDDLQVHTYSEGNLTRVSPIGSYKFVLRHQDGQFNNPNANIALQTAFPEP